MKIDGYHAPKSSFLSMEKDTGIIIEQMLKNNRLKKLLYYTTKDALYRENLTQEQTLGLIENNIKLVPKFKVDNPVLNYIVISFDNFTPSENPEFRDNTIEFDILCHYDQWHLTDFALRPYKIAGELDSMFDKSRLTGLGKLEFMGGDTISLNDEFAGVCLLYRAVHGEEDKKFMPNPNDDEGFIKDFKDFINS